MHDMPSAPVPAQEPPHSQQPNHMAGSPPQTEHQPHSAEHAQHSDYPSSPIETTKQALKRFWQNGKNAFAGILVVQSLVGILGLIGTAIAWVAIVLSLIGVLFSSNETLINLVATRSNADPGSLAAGMQILVGAGVIVALVAGLIGSLLLSYATVLAATYASVTVLDNQRAQFGQVLAMAFKRTGAMFAQMLIYWAILLAAGLLMMILFAISPFSIFVVAPAFLIFILILTFRVALAQIALAGLKMGPVQSIKYSWQLTKGRTTEIMGIMGIILFVSAVTSVVFTILHVVSGAVPFIAGLFYFLELVVGMALSIVISAQFALRLEQMRSATHGHKVNVGQNVGIFAGAIVAIILAGVISNALMPPSTTSNDWLEQLQQDQQYEDTLNDSQYYNDELQQQLEDYYNRSQQLQEQYESQLQDYEYDNSTQFN